ncbi:hypothetical protein CBF34_11090 [Vagococcus penaei]|uniref:Uncharacterized protein n=1 Tax=Vagococcus penaei TaxID=633807 RepID=A0A1Q2D5Q8_9ENTE|nr:hypothetical protein BW732_04920 [Vagococcus penaei]RST97342.1 hypothetical protein CBF34_11090 [Vagococcus penaei]
MSKRASIGFYSLEALVSKEPLLKELDKDVDFNFIYLLAKDKYDRLNGRPILDSIMLIKLPDGGYIWHVICLSERQKGYGKAILKATLKEAEKIDLSQILVTCDESNIGSNRIILTNRDLLENKLYDVVANKWVNRYWFKF